MQRIAYEADINGEIYIDLFAGGGGASLGIEKALGLPVTVAINHSPAAITMHKRNHPATHHLTEDVWEANPAHVAAGRKVGLLWLSPDCKHFSKAKGGKPADKSIRSLAWAGVRWAALVRPRLIILENVEEFKSWGRLDENGRPDPRYKGETFNSFVQQLRDLGYVVEWKELRACDFGAPTWRKRFVLIARNDGKPIVWPEASHGDPESEAVRSGKLLPWRTAAEIIDWSLPCPSIFESKAEIKRKYGVNAVRPLADNTMKRVACGTDKFTLKSGNPFIVKTNHTTNKGTYDCFRGQSIDEPMQTLTGKLGYGVAAPVMVAIGQTGFSEERAYPVTEPVRTIVSKAEQCVAMPELAPFCMVNNENARGSAVDEPIHTVTTGGHHMVIAPSLIQYHQERPGEYVRGQEVTQPIMTLDASARYGLSLATMVKYYGQGIGQAVTEPAHTITTKDREALVLAHISKFKGTNIGQRPTAPLQTITAQSNPYAVVKTYIAKIEYAQDLRHWPEVRAMLNKYCGYSLADDEILLIEYAGFLWFIADIGLRMLTPRELFLAQGFPADYEIDTDAEGKPYPKSEQVARCGNSVCPPLAEALVRANMPERAAQRRFATMAELNEYMGLCG